MEYQYYNMFGIKYKFNYEFAGSMDAENVIQEDTTLVDLSKYEYSKCLNALKDSNVTLKYTQDKFLSMVNNDFKWYLGKITHRATINDRSFSDIASHVFDDLVYSDRAFSFKSDTKFPIEYDADLKYSKYSKAKRVKVIIE
jgi:hypothetical protein